MILTVQTKKNKQILDITDDTSSIIEKSGVTNGICSIFIKHTTASLTTADLDTGTDLDMLDAFGVVIPKLHFRHPHNPTHVPDHILSSLIGPSITIPITQGHLDLGIWQRLVLVELDGPREREIIITCLVSR